jgi:dTDP-4-amino-4,6-dideoxygalactose transaminase
LGSRQKYAHEVIGINSRLDALQAKFLQIKLQDLDSHNEQRRQAARLYDSLLNDLTHIRVPQRDSTVDTYHVYYIFVDNKETRSALQAYLKHRGIDTNIHYPTPMNRLQCFQHLPSASTPDTCPHAAEFGNTCLSLPMFPGLTEKEIDTVCKEIHAFFQ